MPAWTALGTKSSTSVTCLGRRSARAASGERERGRRGGQRAGQERVHDAAWDDPASACCKRIPPEFHPYLRRVAILIVLAALAGVVLALVVPPGPHH